MLHCAVQFVCLCVCVLLSVLLFVLFHFVNKCVVLYRPLIITTLSYTALCYPLQVYSAEEKRALALITFEEKQQKENKVVGDFRAMLSKQLGLGVQGPAQEHE